MTRAADVVALAASRAPTLGTGRLVCVDGPAGSGKSTLAAQIGALGDELGGALVVHMDDLYPGWDGLFDTDPAVLDLLRPLAEDMTGYYRRWDWSASEYRETHHVDPAPLLVLEGVGSGNRAWADLVTVLVWVEAPAELRLARGLARDGDALREQWLAWTRDEARLFEEQGTRARADVLVDTSRAR